MDFIDCYNGVMGGKCISLFISVVSLNDPKASLSDHLLIAVLSLLKKEVSEHGRHLPQYFHLFYMYAGLGVAEVRHGKVELISLDS